MYVSVFQVWKCRSHEQAGNSSPMWSLSRRNWTQEYTESLLAGYNTLTFPNTHTHTHIHTHTQMLTTHVQKVNPYADAYARINPCFPSIFMPLTSFSQRLCGHKRALTQLRRRWVKSDHMTPLTPEGQRGHLSKWRLKWTVTSGGRGIIHNNVRKVRPAGNYTFSSQRWSYLLKYPRRHYFF